MAIKVVKRLIPSSFLLYRVRTRRHCVYLTFDDGPHPEFTPQILDILAANGANATFFVVGKRALAFPQIVMRMVSEGHVVGAHSQNHLILPRLRRQTLADEIDRSCQSIVLAGAVRPSFFRPPQGRFGLREFIYLKRKKLQVTLWSEDTINRGIETPQEALCAFRRSKLRLGSIILLHDTDPRVLNLLPEILGHLKKQGWECLSLGVGSSTAH